MNYEGINYIITRRINQDIVENLYSYLKAMCGANTHLSPHDFKHCLKWYLLGKHASVPLLQNTNTEDTIDSRLIDTECLTASIINESEVLNDVGATLETSNIVMPQEQMDLLELFEVESQNFTKTVDDEPLEYVVGYVAKRFIDKYPNLGEETSKQYDHSSSTSWIQHMSKGHLITLSKTLMEVAKIMNRHFENMHSTSLDKSPNVMENLKLKVLSECNGLLPDDVLSCLIRTRTFVRFNHLNKIIDDKVPTISKNNKLRKFIN